MGSLESKECLLASLRLGGEPLLLEFLVAGEAVLLVTLCENEPRGSSLQYVFSHGLLKRVSPGSWLEQLHGARHVLEPSVLLRIGIFHSMRKGEEVYKDLHLSR